MLKMFYYLKLDHIVIATGAKWRERWFWRSNLLGINNLNILNNIFTPDDIMTWPQSPKRRGCCF